MHRYLNTTHRTVAWFKKAFDAEELDIKAPFQRNPVWSDRQKGALIETILLEYPIPELYMQELIDAAGGERHVVVDGQQRIRAVLSFLAGEFTLDDESPVAQGLAFEDLTTADRKKLYEYSFVVRLLPEMPDEELRSIFQRINRNTVTLNPQELRHATYWGPFIKLMEELADLDAWSNFGIFSANDRRRMLDSEYISELAIAVLNGPQNKKRTLEEYYQQYETTFDGRDELLSLFVKVLGEIEQALPNIAKTRWKKKSDFYSLFLALAKRHTKLPMPAEARAQMAIALAELAGTIDGLIAETVDPANASEDAKKYLRYVERAASDLGSRRARDQVLDALFLPILGDA
jgi:uncharacterized protein with ParB-like and HNH nuclease domain